VASDRAVNARVAFLAKPRLRALPKPHSRLTTPNTCSTRERMRYLLRFLVLRASLTTPVCRVRWW